MRRGVLLDSSQLAHKARRTDAMRNSEFRTRRHDGVAVAADDFQGKRALEIGTLGCANHARTEAPIVSKAVWAVHSRIIVFDGSF
jgi:hypothetical protein